MSKRSEGQYWKMIMTYPPWDTLEETKPWEQSRNTTGGLESKIGLLNISKVVQDANNQKSSCTGNAHLCTTSPLKRVCPHLIWLMKKKVAGLPWKWQHLRTSWSGVCPGSSLGVSQALALEQHKREAESPHKNSNLHYHFIWIIHHSSPMAFSPAPLLVQLPGHLKHELVIVTNQFINSTTCTDPIPLNQITIPGPLHNLETNAFWDRPLFPCTVQNVLAGHKNLAPTQL